MSNIADKIAEDITKDARNTLNRVTRHIANRVADDWMIKAISVMDDYYGDYSRTTRRYKRTYSLFNDSIIPVFYKKTLNIDGDRFNAYRVGIKFSPDKMNHGQMPMFNEESIFENFMFGAHGNATYAGVENARKIFNTTPCAKSVLDAYYSNYDAQFDKYFNEAVKLHN